MNIGWTPPPFLRMLKNAIFARKGFPKAFLTLMFGWWWIWGCKWYFHGVKTCQFEWGDICSAKYDELPNISNCSKLSFYVCLISKSCAHTHNSWEQTLERRIWFFEELLRTSKLWIFEATTLRKQSRKHILSIKNSRCLHKSLAMAKLIRIRARCKLEKVDTRSSFLSVTAIMTGSTQLFEGAHLTGGVTRFCRESSKSHGFYDRGSENTIPCRK